MLKNFTGELSCEIGGTGARVQWEMLIELR